MRALNLAVIAALAGAWPLGGTAYADAQDIPAQLCRPDFVGITTLSYDAHGVSNTSWTTLATVDCAIALYAGTGRTLFVGGTDHNKSIDFTCNIGGTDSLRQIVPIVNQSGISGGTYTDGTIMFASIPDNVVALYLSCTIPWNQNGASSLSDIFIQN